jgi:hypothetical protein
LIEQLAEMLRVNELPDANEAALSRLRSAMRPFRLELDETYEVHHLIYPSIDHLPDEPALRDHIDRIQRALRDGDDAQLLGSTKELLETTAKVVRTGHGRHVAPPPLGRRHARLAAGAGVTVATLLLDTLDDANAPWRKGSAAPRQ